MNPPEHYRDRYHAGEITPTRDGHRRHRRHGWAGRLGEDVARAMDALQAWAAHESLREEEHGHAHHRHSSYSLGLFVAWG